MSAFAIFVLVLTVIYVIYYSAIIMQDLYAKKDAPKTEEEDFDVSQMQNQEEPISITEDANGFHLNGDTTEEQEEPSSVTWIENDDDANNTRKRLRRNIPVSRKNASVCRIPWKTWMLTAQVKLRLMSW